MRNGLVEGVSLRAVLRESGAMAPEAAASVLAGMLVTLAVVHGDVCPEHVRVDGSGGLALTDFGAAEAGFVPNVPTYLAPERLAGAAASPAADVFSATAVFFECLTNESPFVAKNRDDLAALYEYAEVIAEFATPELRPLAQHGLAPDPARRPASPHAFLDEVAATASAAYGADWQQRGRALLSGWAVAAAAAEGVELAVPRGPEAAAPAAAVTGEPLAAPFEAPPVGEPIDEALLGPDAEDEVPAATEAAETMPPPFGEPIDEALLDAVDEPTEPGAEPETGDNANYDWFSGGGKPSASASVADPPGSEADVLAAFDGARAARTAETNPAPYTPTGFDVFADRSGAPAAEAEAEPVSGHWDLGEDGEDADAEAEAEDGGPAAGFSALDAEQDAADEQGDDAAEAEEPDNTTAERAGETEPETLGDEAEVAPLSEDSAELLAAFDAFAPPSAADVEEPEAAEESEPEDATPAEVDGAESDDGGLEAASGADSEPEADSDAIFEAAAEAGSEAEAEAESGSVAESEADSGSDSAFEAEPEPEPEAGSVAEAEADSGSDSDSDSASEAEPLPKRDPFAGLGLQTLAAGSIVKAETSPAPEAEHQAEVPEPEPEAEPGIEPELEAEPEPEPEPQPEAPEPTTTRRDLEDDWVIPSQPSPRVPRSLSAFAVSLPTMPRPKADAEPAEPKPPVQTSAPDDWFRPGVAAPAAGDAQHTQVLDPDRDNTVEREATRTLDKVAADALEDAAAAAAADAAGDDDEGADAGFVGAAGPGGPRRKTVVGAVATAVLLVAGAAAVVLGGSGKSPQGSTGNPVETSSNSASPTAVPTTPVGTSDASGDSSSSSSTPSSHHSSTHSHSKSSSSSASHSASDTSSHSSASETPTDHSSSSSPSSGSTSSTCPPGILGIPVCPTTTSHSTPSDSSTSTSSTPGGGGTN